MVATGGTRGGLSWGIAVFATSVSQYNLVQTTNSQDASCNQGQSQKGAAAFGLIVLNNNSADNTCRLPKDSNNDNILEYTPNNHDYEGMQEDINVYHHHSKNEADAVDDVDVNVPNDIVDPNVDVPNFFANPNANANADAKSATREDHKDFLTVRMTTRYVLHQQTF